MNLPQVLNKWHSAVSNEEEFKEVAEQMNVIINLAKEHVTSKANFNKEIKVINTQKMKYNPKPAPGVKGP